MIWVPTVGDGDRSQRHFTSSMKCVTDPTVVPPCWIAHHQLPDRSSNLGVEPLGRLELTE